MITAIREVRRTRGLTLEDVARRCSPPTTAQTIGRLEMGTRTVSVAWLNRIAAALEVEASDLVSLPGRGDLAVAATLGPDGAHAPRKPARIVPPQPSAGAVAVTVTAGTGDYRAGDEIWCDMLAPDGYAGALNRDVLAPMAAGRFVFGRLIAAEKGDVTILPLATGAGTQAIEAAPWLAVAARLVRGL
ncbi:helix-turn-helix transcriptional regulator [Sphingomonas sp. CL5.1]|uniref:helix-turn-helix domain-containing protein n=1 Tax=Sphingomonas sp. CL5.1 TaxID=2653203 RepID=UPI0015818578|nr:helix-turn-helix transcriptional regulator [Sphingomonas sp. CL5.1]QKR98752.1 helix-turn-helix transcriptional regulator [Sphingomonas sp. CL5.1]